jgi:hypothetical protein
MLINLSNHPTSVWEANQIIQAEKQYGVVRDLPFPSINPCLSTSEIKQLAEDNYLKIIDLLKESNDLNNAVHIMGELTFVFALVEKLKTKKIDALASTTDRSAVTQTDGSKLSKFIFKKFRNYY